MGTPFISLLEPTRLDAYDSTKPHSAQAPSIPPIFVDAMAVRESVFVGEQGIPLAHEHDADDARSCHWVAYASVGAAPGSVSGNSSPPPSPAGVRSSSTVPIGTLRLVPFPHPPHPRPGARYVDNQLVAPSPPLASTSTSTSTSTQDPSSPATATANHAPTAAELSRHAAAQPFGLDRATTYHDGREPYVQIGRVAVVAEFRGHNIATQLWLAARRWLESHPAYFDPSVAELGMDRLEVAGAAAGDVPKWNGLVCCHGQESAVRLYERWGFRVDEGMGRWLEEGIPHVGLFLRLRIEGGPVPKYEGTI